MRILDFSVPQGLSGEWVSTERNRLVAIGVVGIVRRDLHRENSIAQLHTKIRPSAHGPVSAQDRIR